jgi:hypothetical protein
MVQRAETSASARLDSPATTTINSKETEAKTSKDPSFDIRLALLNLQYMMQEQLKGCKELHEILDSHHEKGMKTIARLEKCKPS